MIRSLVQIAKKSDTQSLVFTQVYFKTQYIRQPKLKFRTCVPIYPPPGLNLEIPDWDKELFLKRIGGGTSEYADKFDNLQEIFTSTSKQMADKGVPPKARKYILSMKEQLRRGVVTFEYLSRRTCLEQLKD
ncbi:IGR motif protein (macronuclear) [Tetrahymena thermophila SB210]|uniref:Small ribosomal subunit protein mS41 n=1 Tax=Tetrahymena thermophila (strain SB210) TaxID=312017 RepID=Q22FZ4_TETTS|nr:IGR motif protein [Tetrahymena thermophila SB210]EAR84232.1 IGR motif protein [Tetrahymena thermophila SB210]6Z1P_BD Chain BD, IGR motif protein [Tetrahymena thermophila SB210]|eukprot:XP_001031895.1 IGR motif protein [Tetrahymena thermophila SB210]